MHQISTHTHSPKKLHFHTSLFTALFTSAIVTYPPNYILFSLKVIKLTQIEFRMMEMIHAFPSDAKRKGSLRLPSGSQYFGEEAHMKYS
jgi:hypothetical protein